MGDRGGGYSFFPETALSKVLPFSLVGAMRILFRLPATVGSKMTPQPGSHTLEVGMLWQPLPALLLRVGMQGLFHSKALIDCFMDGLCCSKLLSLLRPQIIHAEPPSHLCSAQGREHSEFRLHMALAGMGPEPTHLSPSPCLFSLSEKDTPQGVFLLWI